MAQVAQVVTVALAQHLQSQVHPHTMLAAAVVDRATAQAPLVELAALALVVMEPYKVYLFRLLVQRILDQVQGVEHIMMLLEQTVPQEALA